MKRILRLLALLVVVAAGITWAATGANRGWTKTSVPVKTLDTVTGIEGITYQPKFLPGLDFLGAALGCAVLLAGATCLFRQQGVPDNQPDLEHRRSGGPIVIRKGKPPSAPKRWPMPSASATVVK